MWEDYNVSRLERSYFKLKTRKDEKTYARLRTIFLHAWEKAPHRKITPQTCLIPHDCAKLARYVIEFLERYGLINYDVPKYIEPKFLRPKPAVEKDSLAVVVVGAGLAGLTCAKRLKDLGHKVKILEASDCIGGRIHSVKSKNGHIVDLGASSFLKRRTSPGLCSLYNPISIKARQANLKVMQCQNILMYDQKGYVKPSTTEKVKNFWRLVFSKLQQVRRLDPDIVKKEMARLYPDEARKIARLSGSALDSELTCENWVDLCFEKLHQAEKLASEAENRVADFCRRKIERRIGDFDEIGIESWANVIFEEKFVSSGMCSLLPKTDTADVKLNEKVICIEKQGEMTAVHSETQTYFADAVVVATPMTQLQEEKIQFKPALPKQKCASMAFLDTSVCHRFALEFPQPFWSTHLRIPGIDFDAVAKIGNDLCFSYVGEDDFQVEFENLWALRKAPVLVAVFSGGDVVEQFNEMTTEKLKAKLMGILRKWFGKVPDPVWVSRTSESGFHPNIPIKSPGCSAAHIERIAEPINDSKIFFVGSATDVESFGSLNGSFRSGMKAAGEIHGLTNPLPSFLEFQCPKSLEIKEDRPEPSPSYRRREVYGSSSSSSEDDDDDQGVSWSSVNDLKPGALVHVKKEPLPRKPPPKAKPSAIVQKKRAKKEHTAPTKDTAQTTHKKPSDARRQLLKMKKKGNHRKSKKQTFLKDTKVEQHLNLSYPPPPISVLANSGGKKENNGALVKGNGVPALSSDFYTRKKRIIQSEAPRNKKRVKVAHEAESPYMKPTSPVKSPTSPKSPGLPTGFYYVERILNHKYVKNKGKHYLVKWEGFPIEEASWEPASQVPQSSVTIYKRQLKDRKQEMQQVKKNTIQLHSLIARQKHKFQKPQTAGTQRYWLSDEDDEDSEDEVATSSIKTQL